MYKGGIKIIVLFLAVVVVVFLSASMIGFDTIPSAQDVQQKAGEIVSQNNQKIVDKVVDESRTAVGEKLKETGEKLLSRDGEKGEVIAYNENVIGKRSYTVIMFTAQWCPSCVQTQNDIARFKDEIPGAVTIMMADYDDVVLRERYAVNAQHSFILLDASGNEVKRWEKSMSLQEILGQITE